MHTNAIIYHIVNCNPNNASRNILRHYRSPVVSYEYATVPMHRTHDFRKIIFSNTNNACLCIISDIR